MRPIDHMPQRAEIYDPTATFRIRDLWDGPGSNPVFVDWSGSLPEPTREQLEAVALPSLGTRWGPRMDAFLARTDDTALMINAGYRVFVEELQSLGSAITLGQFVTRAKDKAKDILDA